MRIVLSHLVLRDLKIIMVSARTEDLWRQRAKDSGADGYITKPLDIEGFVSQVEAVLGEAAA